MARANYSHEKRQRDLARQKKQEEKRQRRLNKGAKPGGEAPTEPGTAPEAKQPETS